MNYCRLFKQCGHMVKKRSSVNPRQLLCYAPWVPKAPRTEYILLPCAILYTFSVPATEVWEVSNKSPCKSEAQKSWAGRRVRGGREVVAGIYPLPRGTVRSVGPAAMLKPSVGSLSRGHVKQDVCWGLTFHGPNYNIIIRRGVRLHSSPRWDSVSMWKGDEWKPHVAFTYSCSPGVVKSRPILL